MSDIKNSFEQYKNSQIKVGKQRCIIRGLIKLR